MGINIVLVNHWCLWAYFDKIERNKDKQRSICSPGFYKNKLYSKFVMFLVNNALVHVVSMLNLKHVIANTKMNLMQLIIVEPGSISNEIFGYL